MLQHASRSSTTRITGMQCMELQMRGAGLVVAAGGAVRRPRKDHTVSQKPVVSECLVPMMVL